MMRILVTGGAGYIGSVVTEQLVEQGHAVLVFDNLSKGHRDAVVDGAEFVQADLRDYAEVVRALRTFDADAVVHLAADSLVGESMTNPAKYYANNVVAGLTLLGAMKAAEVDRVVFSSTAAVYGEPERQPVEETAPTQPTNPYGETKLAFEHALRWHYETYGIASLSLRYFNAAGATERNGERHSPETHLIPIVLQAAAGESGPVTIFGDDYPTRDGTCVRDYIHVQDLARAHVAALESLINAPACRAYNLGCGGMGYTVREVIDAVERVTRRQVPLRRAGRRPGDPAVLVASSERIRCDLQWAPRFQNLDEIVASAWRWMGRRTSPTVS
jgi:UDP-glucose 4-epimerase